MNEMTSQAVRFPHFISLFMCFLSPILNSVYIDISEEVPTNGGSRGAEYSGDHFWKEEQDSGLLPVMAKVQDSQK